MAHDHPAHAAAPRRRPAIIAAAGLLSAALFVFTILPPSPSAPERVSPALSSAPPLASPAPPIAPPRAEHDAAVTNPDAVTVFDHGDPAVANLDPSLLHALRDAARNAAGDGVEFLINSGWRSPEHQRRLLREAVAKYGSEAKAARWVATARTSPHVSGGAVDIGPSAAAAWLSRHGARFGLCQVYQNEPWHYELRPGAADRGCPPMYPDPTHDPRMRQ